MELARICQNCSSFFQNSTDYHNDMGVCVSDPAFEPFWDAILEAGDFSSCRELYEARRYDGSRAACSKYEEIEILFDDEEEPMNLGDQIQNGPIDHLKAQLLAPSETAAHEAAEQLVFRATFGNPEAMAALVEYYIGLGPAESLPEVHRRVRIIKELCRHDTLEMIPALMMELFRTESNNMTRQLYTVIIDKLSRFPQEIIEEPVLALLSAKKFSPKIKKRILDIITEPKPFYWLDF